jgi:SAM-dependent methyltransferase
VAGCDAAAAALMTRAAWDRLASSYAERAGLMPPERELLRRLHGRLHTIDMLDLGVGAGRTTEIFEPLVSAYVGVDFSEKMIAEARRRLGASTSALLEIGDVRDLSRWHGRGFDLVLFSFNGIDYVEGEERGRVLREVRRVMSSDGTFAFSTHSLNALPLSARPPRPLRRDPIRSSIRSLRRAARLAALNRTLDLDEARALGWTRIRDGAHDFANVRTTYVDPGYELRELSAAGFRVEDVLDAGGARVDPAQPGSEAHLFYICGMSATEDA